MAAGQIRIRDHSNGSEMLRCYTCRMKHVWNGLLGLTVLLWAVTAGERTYVRHHASQAVKAACANEPTRLFSKYQYTGCLRRGTSQAARRADA
jgi:hypothetical protein